MGLGETQRRSWELLARWPAEVADVVDCGAFRIACLLLRVLGNAEWPGLAGEQRGLHIARGKERFWVLVLRPTIGVEVDPRILII